MRNRARPVLLRSLKVIGGVTASSSEALAANRFGLLADDEIRIESVLPSWKVVVMDILDLHEQERSSLHLALHKEKPRDFHYMVGVFTTRLRGRVSRITQEATTPERKVTPAMTPMVQEIPNRSASTPASSAPMPYP